MIETWMWVVFYGVSGLALLALVTDPYSRRLGVFATTVIGLVAILPLFYSDWTCWWWFPYCF